MNRIVEVSGLTKVFDNHKKAVDAISFEMFEGEILGLIGPNGAGKTTTLQMLLGLTTPTSGRIRIFGLDIDSDREEILRQVNFSSSYISLPYSLTVEENLTVFSRLYSVKNYKDRIAELPPYLRDRGDTPHAHEKALLRADNEGVPVQGAPQQPEGLISRRADREPRP